MFYISYQRKLLHLDVAKSMLILVKWEFTVCPSLRRLETHEQS